MSEISINDTNGMSECLFMYVSNRYTCVYLISNLYTYAYTYVQMYTELVDLSSFSLHMNITRKIRNKMLAYLYTFFIYVSTMCVYEWI